MDRETGAFAAGEGESTGAGAGLHEPAAGLTAAEPAVADMPAPPSAPQPPTRRARLQRWWSASTPNMRGSVCMISAFIFFSAMLTLIKLLGERLPLAQMLVVRQALALVIFAAVLRQGLRTIMRTRRPALQIGRGFLSLGAMFGTFLAIIHLPMAEATALGFSQVLFVTLGAILVLGEKVDLRRWIAMLVGFLGVLIILRPSGQAMNIYALTALAGAIFGAGLTITVRILGETEKTQTILFWQGATTLSLMSGPAIAFWVPPTASEWLLLIVLGVVGAAGQWLITRAYQIGQAAALAPLDFIRLLLATAIGFIVFNEIPDLATALGAGLVVFGTLYTVRRNSRRDLTPVPAEAPEVAPAARPETDRT